jgi:hypothetical protein
MGIQHINNLGEIGERPGEAVDLIDNDDLNLAGLDVLQKPLEGRPLHGPAGQASVVIHIGKRDPSGMTLAHDVGLARLPLGVERIEFLFEALVGRFASVDRAADGEPGSRGISPGHGCLSRVR